MFVAPNANNQKDVEFGIYTWNTGGIYDANQTLRIDDIYITGTPICAHDMGSRCVVASDRRVVTVRMVQNARRNAYLSVDGGKALRLNMGDVATIRKSRFETKLVKLNNRSFYDVVNAKFQRKLG